jgi:hypothetical protein
MSFRALSLAALVLVSTTGALAQTADAQKQKLAQRVVELWKPERVVAAMVQQPAISAMDQSRIALQGRVDANRQAATLKDIASDVQKYVDEATPIALEAAKKEGQQVVVPLLMKEFSVEELQQIVTMLESPVRAKFDVAMPRLEKALGEKVAADVGPQIDPKLKAMTEAVGTKLRHAAGQ